MLNASISYFSANDRYRIALFGRNLTDEEYQTSGLSVANLWNFSTYIWHASFDVMTYLGSNIAKEILFFVSWSIG